MVYLELFHGRKDPHEDMPDWGSQGPVFGPLAWVHTTYAFHIKLGYPPDFPFRDLQIISELVYYDGVYYGDWSVFPESTFKEHMSDANNFGGRLVTYNENLAKPPLQLTKNENSLLRRIFTMGKRLQKQKEPQAD